MHRVHRGRGRLLRRSVVVVLGLVLAGTVSAAPAHAADPVLAGVITDSATGKPLADVEVTLWRITYDAQGRVDDARMPDWGFGSTQSDGSYWFGDEIPPGRY